MSPLDGSSLPNLELQVSSDDVFDVREFSVHERMSSLFSVTLVALCDNPNVDFEAVAGRPAAFQVRSDHARYWTGICSELQQIAVEEGGLSTYHITLVPLLWLTTQRRNHRMFQQISEPDIVLKVLSEWGIEPELKIDKGAYKKRKYRVQYAESDFAFISRMLEDAGISFYFAQKGGQSVLTLADAPQANAARPPIAFRDNPTDAQREHVTALRVGRQVRPGRYTMRDHDYRRPPDYKLVASASESALDVEEQLERFHYTPGAFLFGAEKGDDTPVADDRGKARTDEGEGAVLAKKRLEAKRASAKTFTFQTNAYDLAPGSVLSVLDHPRADLGAGRSLLVVESMLSGTSDGDWTHHVEARTAEAAYRPALVTPKPKVVGVESATVVGPAGEEIHCDEFGRVRVHFHWDRESQMNEQSSCWIHVSQPWAGTGFGGVNLPRIGQEVIVDFLGGDPDRPIITGRVYTNLTKVPFGLPANKTQSGWKSNSTGGGGGYNEIMFEDAQGKEQVRVQAERDMNKLVKHDESSVVGNDRTRLVKGNEAVTVAKNLTRNVKQNTRDVIGQNLSVVVGVNRSAQVGAVDSTTVGTQHSVAISPPAAAPGAPARSPTSTAMQDKKIVFSTGTGASITLEDKKITLEAETIFIHAKSYLGTVSDGEAGHAGAKGLLLGSRAGDVKINGGPTVLINGPGMPAGRLGDTAPAVITNGSTTVQIGGPSLPFEATVLPNGDIQVGNAMTITGSPEFKGKVMTRLGQIGQTNSGMQTLNTINNSGRTMTIQEYTGNNSFCGPNQTWADWAASHPAGQQVYDGAGNPIIGPDGNPLMGTGTGANVTLQLNPDLTLPNPHDPNNPMPNDAVMFHEMTHGAHQMTGTSSGAPEPGGWDTHEELETISTGNPSEADYLQEIGYPWQRTDHDLGYAPNP
ncbi:MAG: type VI secretion system tip protein VgrG [Polyangiaceae bacterium]|nr:type VI secretion system tip protein VgrG [Polyangiaceae bacterium]